MKTQRDNEGRTAPWVMRINKVGLPNKKVIGLFCFADGTNKCGSGRCVVLRRRDVI